MGNKLMALLNTTGFVHLTPGMIVMWIIGLLLIYLAIKKQYEPLLLLPIGFGILLVNLPLSGLMEPDVGLLWKFYHYGIHWEIIPPLIFLGIGAFTDFGPMLANPRLIFLGAGAQAGVYITFFASHAMGYNIMEAATIGMIGGADGPTTIFISSKTRPPTARGLCRGRLFLYGHGSHYPAPDHASDDHQGGTCHADGKAPAGEQTGKIAVSHHFDLCDRPADSGVGPINRHAHAGQPVPGIRSGGTVERCRPE